MFNNNCIRADGDCELFDAWDDELEVCMQDEGLTAEFANRGIGFLIRVTNANANVDQFFDSIFEEFECYSLHYKGEIPDYLFRKYQNYTFLKHGYHMGNKFCTCSRTQTNGDLSVGLFNIKGEEEFDFDAFIKYRKVEFSGEIMN